MEGVPMGQRSSQSRIVHSMPEAPGKQICFTKAVFHRPEMLGFLIINPLCVERS